jgi:hypothetical protein
MPPLKLSPKGHRYGLIPAPAKATDNGFPSKIITHTGAFPASAAITGKVGPIKDQGQQGSCDGHACSEMGERLYLRWKPEIPFVQFSPAFSYYRERQLEGTVSQGDCGAQISSACIVPDPNAAGGIGWCPLSIMPYDDTDCSTAPDQVQLDAAAKYPGGAFHSIGNNIANIKSCILSDYTFVIGIAVYDSFESDQTASTGLVPYPATDENLQGYHALHAGLAYDDTMKLPNSPNPGAVKFMNSWGTSWGQDGFAWLSYDFLMNAALTTDVRLGHLGKPW